MRLYQRGKQGTWWVDLGDIAGQRARRSTGTTDHDAAKEYAAALASIQITHDCPRTDDGFCAFPFVECAPDDLAAIAATLEAMRAIERHGGAMILERAFTGFTALPAPAAVREWWDVLECQRDASPEVIKAQYRRLASEHHPDKGGDPGRMAEVNAAWARAQGAT